jgi:hypothetical protein
MRPSRILLLLFVVAALGVGLFVYLASKTVAFEQADEPDAMRRFQTERAAFGSALPMLEVDPSGRIVRHASPQSEGARHLERLRILVYNARPTARMRSSRGAWRGIDRYPCRNGRLIFTAWFTRTSCRPLASGRRFS